MIVIDVNILVYAYSPDSPHHDACRSWIENALGAAEPIGLPLSVIHSFLRLLTLPIVVSTPQTIDAVTNRVDEWLMVPNVAVLNPGPRYWPILRRLLVEKRISGNLITTPTSPLSRLRMAQAFARPIVIFSDSTS